MLTVKLLVQLSFVTSATGGRRYCSVRHLFVCLYCLCIQPVKNWVTRCWHGYLSGVRSKWFCIWSSSCHCHPVTSCFLKIQNGFSFLVPAYPDCPVKEAIKRLSVCLFCLLVSFSAGWLKSYWWIFIKSGKETDYWRKHEFIKCWNFRVKVRGYGYG